MEVFNWSEKENAIIAGSGMLLVTDPRTGEYWLNQKQAKDWWQLEQEANTANHKVDAVARIYIEPVTVKENTGSLIANKHVEGQPSELTISAGSVLNIKAHLNQPGSADTKIDLLDNQLFRIPLKNQKTSEVLLFAGLVEQGQVEVEVSLTQAGFWLVDEQLINEKLPVDMQLEMQPLTISVVNTEKSLLAKLAALINKG